MDKNFLDRKKLEEFLQWRDLVKLSLYKYEAILHLAISKTAVIKTRPFDPARLRSRISPSFLIFSIFKNTNIQQVDKVFLDRSKAKGFTQWRDLVQKLLNKYEANLKKKICEANFYCFSISKAHGEAIPTLHCTLQGPFEGCNLLGA